MAAGGQGSAINNAGSTVTATNNWWGSNTDPSALFFGLSPANYNPWMVVSVNANPPSPLPGHITTITADFTQTAWVTIPCNLPDGIPVAFSTTEGTITPPLAVTMSGVATSSLTTNNLASLVCATIDPTAENFLICQAVNSGFS